MDQPRSVKAANLDGDGEVDRLAANRNWATASFFCNSGMDLRNPYFLQCLGFYPSLIFLKQSLQNTSLPCVGSNGTVVGVPQAAQTAS